MSRLESPFEGANILCALSVTTLSVATTDPIRDHGLWIILGRRTILIDGDRFEVLWFVMRMLFYGRVVGLGRFNVSTLFHLEYRSLREVLQLQSSAFMQTHGDEDRLKYLVWAKYLSSDAEAYMQRSPTGEIAMQRRRERSACILRASTCSNFYHRKPRPNIAFIFTLVDASNPRKSVRMDSIRLPQYKFFQT